MNHVRRVKGSPSSGSGERSGKPWGWVLAGAIGMLIALGLIGPCLRDPVNDELARSVRTAVESADQAHRDNDAAYLWPGRLRLLTVILGVSVPIMAAVVLAWLAFRGQPGDRRGGLNSPQLPAGHSGQLPIPPSPEKSAPPLLGDYMDISTGDDHPLAPPAERTAPQRSPSSQADDPS